MLVQIIVLRSEPRLTAHLADDPAMKQAYAEGKDLYCVIASKVFNNNYEDNLEFYPEGTIITLDGNQVVCGHKTHLNKEGKERRAISKQILLAITYGMAPSTLAKRLGKTNQEAQEIFDSFFKSFPKVEELIKNSKEFLRTHGYVEDWAGRRRHLTDYFLNPYEAAYKNEEELIEKTFNPILGCENRPLMDNTLAAWVARAKTTKNNKEFEQLAKEANESGIILTANSGRIAQSERQCLNSRIQGGAGSLTKLAMIQINNSQELNERDAHLVMTIHDEVMLECPALYAEEVSEILPRIMIDAAAPYISVGMKCDPAVEFRWAVDEYTVAIQSEFKKYTEKGYSREEAFEKLYKNHPELSTEAMYKTVSEGTVLEF